MSKKRKLSAIFGLFPISTEQDRQDTINRKNFTNYSRWLARMHREPLNDCEAK